MFAKLFGPPENQVLVMIKPNEKREVSIYVYTECENGIEEGFVAFGESPGEVATAFRSFFQMTEQDARAFAAKTKLITAGEVYG